MGVKVSGTLQAMYIKAVKMLLGVRQSTTNDMCLIEAGYPSLQALVHHRQKTFFEKMIAKRGNMTDDPLIFSLKMTEQDNPHMHKYINDLIEEPRNILEKDLATIKARVTTSTRTKASQYKSFNPDLASHPVYTMEEVVDDDLRTAFTRLRVSSHRLRSETGRWTRTDLADRLCQCGLSVQTEEHVLCQCTLVDHIRRSYANEGIDFKDFMTTEKTKQQLAMVNEILNFYENY